MKKTGKNLHLIDRKHILGFIAFVLCIVAVTAGLLLYFYTHKNSPIVLSVNGNTVCIEEFELLLKENVLQYEQDIRQEYSIPNIKLVREYFEESTEEYQELLLQKNIAHIVELRVEQQLAREYGVVAERFSYKDLMEEMKSENYSRQNKINQDNVVYGLQKFAPEQYYSHYMTNLRSKTIHAIPKDIVSIQDGAVEDYYQKLSGPAFTSQERMCYIIYDISSLQDPSTEEQKEVYQKIKRELTYENPKAVLHKSESFSPTEYQWNPFQLREIIKKDAEVERQLLSLELGEISGVFLLDNRQTIAQYRGFIKAPVLTEDEKAIFRSYLQEEAYEKIVAEKIHAAKTTVNTKAAKKITSKYI